MAPGLSVYVSLADRRNDHRIFIIVGMFVDYGSI